MEEKAREILEKYGQEHVLTAYEHLDDAGKQKLINQIYSIDFEKIKYL